MGKMKKKLIKLSSLFESAMVVLISSLFVVSIVYAATTVGSNISTDGNLDVNGTASTTNATATGYIYVGQDITEPPSWDFGLGDLIVTDDAFVNGQGTSSVSLWVGSAGTANNLDLAGGDLFVQGNAQFASLVYLVTATATSATTSAYLYVGDRFTTPPGFDFDEDLAVSGDLAVNSKATATVALWVGTGVANNLDLTGGDLYVQGNAQFGSLVYLTTATATSATSSSYLAVGFPFTIPPGFNFSEDLAVSGDVAINGKATTSVALWVGTGVANNLDLTGGDLYVQDDLQVAGSIWMQNATITDSLSIGGYASTSGDLIVNGGTIDSATNSPTTTMGIFSRSSNTVTSTVSIGDQAKTQPTTGCLEMVRENGYYKCYVDSQAAFVCAAGRCN